MGPLAAVKFGARPRKRWRKWRLRILAGTAMAPSAKFGV